MKYIVTYRFNDIPYVKEFDNLNQAEFFFNKMKEREYSPSIHIKYGRETETRTQTKKEKV